MFLDQMILSEGTDSGTYDRSQAMIETIRNDPLSYQSPPDGKHVHCLFEEIIFVRSR